jgi:hypothetical protein
MWHTLRPIARLTGKRGVHNMAAQGDAALPEAYDATTGEVISWHWFAWPDAALAWVTLDAFGAGPA